MTIRQAAAYLGLRAKRNTDTIAKMASIPAKVETRIKESLKRFQPVLVQAKARDVGEADTSTLCKDIIAEVFGFDKYSEITAEYQIKSTYCDLAIKIEGKLVLLIEVKAINTELKEAQIKQAVDYGANQGVEWVVLTNAQQWQIYKITYGQPIGSELLVTLDLNTLNPKSKDDIESLFLLSREAQSKSLLSEYHQQRQALSRFAIGAVVLSDPVLAVIRRELKRLSPDVKIEVEEISHVITEEVIKRDVLEGDRAVEAKRKVSKAASKQLRAKAESVEITGEATQTSAIVTAAAVATPSPGA